MEEKNRNMAADVPCREKYWEERSLEDKIEILANSVEFLSNRNVDLENKLLLLNCHSHSENGELVVPLPDRHNYGLSVEHSGRFRNFLNRNPEVRNGMLR